MTAIKICGLKQPDEIELCAELGVEAVGFNFVPGSARQIELTRANALARLARDRCRRVGVVRDATDEELDALLSEVELDLLQFHGDETPERCRGFDVPYIKVLAVTESAGGALDTLVEDAAARYHDACALLLDTASGGASGGTGKRFDWRRWPAAKTSMPLALAGGLDPSNVADGIRETACAVVDVAGGVEGDVRGVKDLGRIREFVAAVRAADKA